MPENLILYGLEEVHIAFQENGGYEAKVYAIPGAVNLATTPQSEQIIFHADNKRYFVRENNNGYNGTLEMALFLDEIKARMLGWKIDGNGMLVEVADAKPEKFALMGKILGDERDRKFVYYDVMAMRHGQDSATKTETIDPNTQALPITITPIKIGNDYVVKGEIELDEGKNDAVYNNFFDGVALPDTGLDPISILMGELEDLFDLIDSFELESAGFVSGWDRFDAAFDAADEIIKGTPVSPTRQLLVAAIKELQEAFFGLVPVGS